MSIKPVDLQLLLPRTGEMSKYYNDEQGKLASIQKHQAAAENQRTNDGLKQVHSQDKAHEGVIRDKQEKNSRQDGQSKKKQQNSKTITKNKAKDIRTSTIDIRL